MDTNRRKVTMGTAAALIGSFLAGMLRPGISLAAWNQQAFDAKNLHDALQVLGMNAAAQSKDIAIDAPDIAEDGAFVPVQITSQIPGIQSMAVFVDRNPWPLIARLEFMQDALPFVALRLRVAQTSPVRVVVRAGGSNYVSMKDIRVVGGGCDGASTGESDAAPGKTEPMKIRASLAEGVANLRALVTHPMDNGLRTNSSGKIVPENFIRNLHIRLNGNTVIEAEIGRSVSTNPQFAFKVKRAKANDTFALTWQDSRGLTRTDEAAVGG